MASKKDAIIYITRDIERAVGKIPEGNYYIITNTTPYSKDLYKKYPDNILLIESNDTLDTYELLTHKQTEEYLQRFNSKIVVFKNTKQIEEYAVENNIQLLNPSAILAEKIENKISQVKWLRNLSSLLPTHKICLTKDITWNKEIFILQWAHGHTGDGTILVQNEDLLNKIKEKFKDREAKITPFIKGPMFTINIVVSNEKIILGNMSYQITGVLPFTENPFSTIGNDWSLPHTILSEKHVTTLEKMAHDVGEKMKESGWKGLFGIDVIYDEERDSLNLIEINARQPASATYESELQKEIEVDGISIFEAHLLALDNKKITEEIIPINDGAQILQRITTIKKEVDETGLISAGYKVIKYNNIKFNSDLARIQSKKGILETHTKFNRRGKEIIELLG